MGSRTVVDRPLSVVNAVNTTPVTVASASPEPPVRRSEPESPMVLSRIEIVLRDGRVVRVDADVDGGKLAAIIAALEAKV